MISPLTAGFTATPALAGLFAARGGETALNMGSGYFLRGQGAPRQNQPNYAPASNPMPPPPTNWAPPPPQQQQQQGGAVSAQNAGDLPATGWGGEGKAHSRDPAPTVLDPNDPKSKQTHIPQSESFEEYMARRARGQ
eukprot:CAMPEP_0181304638 /NCGR_PEP_ID=MMETSP1101-20121128/9266_1 /TAXON_ID=46948 /ORGANISM="Rhodomonas abbreviata, Strain Caron Lab Isolate" /LENGTH=136 /DNA_ID=CAMNT_0023410427 /DNA_START=57 /DNA_END=467 /DNA_ORIENTATION=-